MSIEEIQEECKRRFPIGCQYKAEGAAIKILRNDMDTYRIVGEYIYAHSGGYCLYKDGEYAEVISVPEGYNLELPKNWCVKITKVNARTLNNWRKNIIKYSEDSCEYPYMYSDGSGGYNSKEDNCTEISFIQFRKYVLPKKVENTNYLIKLFKELEIS